jgi:hypothetical protein
MHGSSFNEDHPEGKVFEHPVYKEHHGLLLQDFANTILCDRPDPSHSAIADQSIVDYHAASIFDADICAGTVRQMEWMHRTRWESPSLRWRSTVQMSLGNGNKYSSLLLAFLQLWRRASTLWQHACK